MGFLTDLLRRLERGPAGTRKRGRRGGRHVGPYSRLTGRAMRARRRKRRAR